MSQADDEISDAEYAAFMAAMDPDFLAPEERSRVESFRSVVARPVLVTAPGDVPVVALPASECELLLAIFDRISPPPTPTEPEES